jgi:hypothetical protein
MLAQHVRVVFADRGLIFDNGDFSAHARSPLDSSWSRRSNSSARRCHDFAIIAQRFCPIRSLPRHQRTL